MILKELREKFLDNILPKLENNSWEEIDLAQVSEEIGLDRGYYKILWDDPIRDLISLYENRCDNSMLVYLGSLDESSISQTIYKALEFRVLSQGFILKANLKFYLKPSNILFAKRTNMKIVDSIWNYLEKKHNMDITNLSFYTKRISLYLVYVLFAMYSITDTSPNKQNSLVFLTNLLKNFKNIGLLKQKLKNGFSKICF